MSFLDELDNTWLLTEADEYALDFKDPEGWWDAHVKYDGCLEVTRRFNAPYPHTDENDIDTMHICDLDEFIERLVALRAQVALKGRVMGWEP